MLLAMYIHYFMLYLRINHFYYKNVKHIKKENGIMDPHIPITSMIINTWLFFFFCYTNIPSHFHPVPDYFKQILDIISSSDISVWYC